MQIKELALKICNKKILLNFTFEWYIINASLHESLWRVATSFIFHFLSTLNASKALKYNLHIPMCYVFNNICITITMGKIDINVKILFRSVV